MANRGCGCRASRGMETGTNSTNGRCRCCCTGDFETSFTAADNSKILPTDTMKNTVYYIARESKAATIEEFAKELGDYLLSNNPQVSKVSIDVAEKSWERMILRGLRGADDFQAGRSGEADRPRGARHGQSMVDHIRRRRAHDSEDHQVGVYGLHQGQADHAEARNRSHLRHLRHGQVGVRGRRSELFRRAKSHGCRAVERVCGPRQHERAAYAIRHGESCAGRSSGDLPDYADDAQPASPARRPEPVRTGQSEPHLCAHRRAARIH